MKNRNTRRGFTLIEMLVVVLIIGILAAVALPQYQKAVAKSRLTKLNSTVRSMYEAQQIYFLENGEWAPDFSLLNIDVGGSPDPQAGTYADNRLYDWGMCRIRTNPAGYIYCFDTGASIGFLMWLDQYQYEQFGLVSPELAPGTMHCMAAMNNEFAQNICKKATGSSFWKFSALESLKNIDGTVSSGWYSYYYK